MGWPELLTDGPSGGGSAHGPLGGGSGDSQSKGRMFQFDSLHLGSHHSLPPAPRGPPLPRRRREEEAKGNSIHEACLLPSIPGVLAGGVCVCVGGGGNRLYI